MAQPGGASREAIKYHYDVGNSFYARWLDERMIYSAALFPDEKGARVSLEDAQRAKLDWHIASAHLKPGDRLLDIGCGWGGLMQRAVETCDLSQAVGLTLADEQAAWIAGHAGDGRIGAQVRNWQDFADEGTFDGIISIGAFEHFARPEMNRAQKIAAYARFFEFCHRNLGEDGHLSLQTITWMNARPDQEADNLPHEIFPESNLPHLTEVVQAADPYFHVVEFHNRGRDYALTLREWLRRMKATREAIAGEYGNDTYRRYKHAFTIFAMGFDYEVTGLCRFSLKKRSARDLLTTDYFRTGG